MPKEEYKYEYVVCVRECRSLTIGKKYMGYGRKSSYDGCTLITNDAGVTLWHLDSYFAKPGEIWGIYQGLSGSYLIPGKLYQLLTSDPRDPKDAYYWVKDDDGGQRAVYYDSVKIIWPIPEQKEERKIIGYKAPFDLFGGTVKKGEVYKQNCFHPEVYMAGDINPGRPIPAEIVLTWEPVYEEEKAKAESLVIGDKRTEVSISQGWIAADGKTWDIKMFREILGNMAHISGPTRSHSYDITIQSIKIGCATFTRDEIQKIVTTYEKYNK